MYVRKVSKNYKVLHGCRLKEKHMVGAHYFINSRVLCLFSGKETVKDAKKEKLEKIREPESCTGRTQVLGVVSHRQNPASVQVQCPASMQAQNPASVQIRSLASEQARRPANMQTNASKSQKDLEKGNTQKELTNNVSHTKKRKNEKQLLHVLTFY